MARNRRPDRGERKQSLGCPLALLGPVCVAIRGRLGDRVYKTYGEKIIVTRVPHFDGYVPSAAQRDRRDRMRAATAFAQAVYANPAAKAVYVAAAQQLRRQPFRLAVSDFLHGRPRVTLAPATPETAKDPKASRIPVNRPAADSPPANVPRTPSDLGTHAAPRRKFRSAILTLCASAPRAKPARDKLRRRFRAEKARRRDECAIRKGSGDRRSLKRMTGRELAH